MTYSDPRRNGTPEQKLEYWSERLANAERLGRPGHIAHVRQRVETLQTIAAARRRDA